MRSGPLIFHHFGERLPVGTAFLSDFLGLGSCPRIEKSHSRPPEMRSIQGYAWRDAGISGPFGQLLVTRPVSFLWPPPN